MKRFSRIISGSWVSTLIQNQKLYNETIKIHQDGSNVHALIKLPYHGKIYDYEFNGKIDNNIVHGIYCSKNHETETGTISLKSINNNTLYGFCTYIREDKSEDIVQSPYLLIKNNKNKIGTYDFCQQCVGHESCCNHIDEDIDLPVLLPQEVKTIKDKYNIKNFVKVINLQKKESNKTLKNIYQIIPSKKTGTCPFYIKNKCTIYSDRPIDCRIFPFDIKLIKNQCYLIRYNYPMCNFKDHEEECIKASSYNVKLFVRIILPYLHEWVVDRFSTKLTKNRPYTIICQIENLF
jgi:Fe-S-cluster containining protein